MFLYSLPFSLYFSTKCLLAQGLFKGSVWLGENWMGLWGELGTSGAWAEK